MVRILSRVLIPTLLLATCVARSTVVASDVEDTADTLASFWIDDDLEKALVQARREKKPLLVIFRCPP